MTDASQPVVQVSEDPDAGPGDRDIADPSEHHEHAIINRRLDEDAV